MAKIKGSARWADYKNKKRLRRKYVRYIPNANYRAIETPANDDDREDIVAPENFSILTNRNAVIEYLDKIVASFLKKQYSIMNMGGINKTDLATIAIVISMMMGKRSLEAKMRKYVNVRIPPAHNEPGQLFRRAQFRQTVTKEGIADHTFFLSRRSTKVNTDYVGDVLNYAKNFLGQESADGLSPIMVEIMQNTNNHANPEKKIDALNIPWFLAVLEDAETGIMTFTVVDLGIGIFESLKLKNLADTSGQFEDAITDMYDNSQTKFLSNNIPKGVNSSTGLSYRGKGLQTVHALANKGNYDTFKIVTNRAIVNILNTDDIRTDSGASFGGTVYYWEMSKNG